MKVLHVTPEYWPATEFGGPVQADRRLISALHRAGVEVQVLTTNMRAKRLPREHAGERRVDGVSVRICSTLGRSLWAPSPDLAVEAWRRTASCDIVHLQGMWTFPIAVAAAACWQTGTPYVMTPRGCLHPRALREKHLKKRAYLAMLGARIVRGAAALHFTTAYEQRTAHPLARATHGFVVPNAVEIEPLTREDLVARRQGRMPRVLILGRVAPIKGFDRLVPAFALLKAAVPAAVLEVVGPSSGQYRDRVEALARQHEVRDAVEFTGWVDDDGRRRALERAWVLVAPSHADSFCMSVAEAMAAAVPVIVTEQVGLHDAVHRARAGIVAEGHPGPLADAMERLLGDPDLCREMGRRGRALAERELSPQAVGPAMVRAYDGVLRSPRV